MIDDYLTSRNKVFSALPDHLQGVLAASPLALLARRAESRMRSTPTTSKGERTVEQILDVTDEMLASTDAHSFTTNHVAVMVGSSVATVYRYFDSLDSIIEMVLLRYEIRIHLMLATLCEPIAWIEDWRTESRQIIEAIAKHRLMTPSRAPIAAIVQTNEAYRPIADAINETSGQIVGSILYRRRPEIELSWWFEIGKVSSMILRPGLSTACSRTPEDRVHIELLKDALERYFRPYLEDPIDTLGLEGRVFRTTAPTGRR